MIMLNKEIEVIAVYTKDGIRPLKFRIEDEDQQWKVYKIDKVLFRKKEVINKTAHIIVRCQGNVDEIMKQYELKFDVANTKWSLYCI